MEARRFDLMAKAAATGVSRRRVLRSVLAIAGGAPLVHLTGGESEAGKRRCCRKEKRELKQACADFYGDACKHLTDFSCVKTGPGQCEADSEGCEKKDGTPCVT